MVYHDYLFEPKHDMNSRWEDWRANLVPGDLVLLGGHQDDPRFVSVWKIDPKVGGLVPTEHLSGQGVMLIRPHYKDPNSLFPTLWEFLSNESVFVVSVDMIFPLNTPLNS